MRPSLGGGQHNENQPTTGDNIHDVCIARKRRGSTLVHQAGALPGPAVHQRRTMSVIDPVVVYEELRALARGRGVRAPKLEARTGPALRRLAGLGEAAGAGARAHLVSWLRAGLTALPADLREVAAVALALDPRADQRILTDRLGLLAVDLDRDPRTLRRRVTDAFRLLAETLVIADVRDRAGPPAAASPTGPDAGEPVRTGAPPV